MTDQQEIQTPNKITFQGKEYLFDSLSDEQKNQVATAIRTKEILGSAQQIALVLANFTSIVNLAVRGASVIADEQAKSFPAPVAPVPAAPEVVPEVAPAPAEDTKVDQAH